MHLLHFSEVSRFNFVLYVIGLSSTLLSHSGHLPARHPHLPTLLLHRHAGESARRPLFASRRLRAPRRSRGSIRDGVSSRSLSHRRTRARTARSFSPRTSGLVFSASLAAWSPASVSRRSSGRCSRRPNDPPPSSSRATSPRAGSPDSSRGTRLRISPYFGHCFFTPRKLVSGVTLLFSAFLLACLVSGMLFRVTAGMGCVVDEEGRVGIWTARAGWVAIGDPI